jgi:hypothetical protein
VAEHDTGREGAEHDVEVHDDGDHSEGDEEQHRQPDDGLPCGLGAGADHREQLGTLTAQLGGERADAHRCQAEEDEHGEGLHRTPGPEQQRHCDDGAELAERAVMHDGIADPCPQPSGVLEDRQERAERRRGQRDRDGDFGMDGPGESEQPGQEQRGGEAGQPGPHALLPARN